MRKLVIDRSIWLRGEGNDRSRLLRSSDGKQCCVGIYLLSCGVKPEAITDFAEPRSAVLPAEAAWIDQHRDRALKLYEANDGEHIPEEERERRIAQGFSDRGVEVQFVDSQSA